jgi:chromosome segregation ATPase
LGELVLEPLNKALQEENGRLKTEIEVLKEREMSKNKEMLLKQELVDDFKAKSKSLEEEIQKVKDEYRKSKDEVERFRDEVSSLREKGIAMRVEIEYLSRTEEDLRRREQELRLERTSERAMFQSMMSNLIGGPEDRKRKLNEDGETN